MAPVVNVIELLRAEIDGENVALTFQIQTRIDPPTMIAISPEDRKAKGRCGYQRMPQRNGAEILDLIRTSFYNGGTGHAGQANEQTTN